MTDGANRDPCGSFKPQVLTASTGVIQSPNYPGNYGFYLDCRWLIETDTDHLILLTFDFFHTELG